MRTFIAIELPKEVKDYLFELERQIDDSNIKVKWVSKKNLHLTLKFIGEIDESKVEEFKNRLSRIKCNAFEASLNKVGFFPNDRLIRVIWVGVEPEKRVIELQEKIDMELLDIVHGDQEFSSHVTLGRVKMIKSKSAFLSKIKEIEIKKIRFKIDSFSFIKSELSKDGPRYSLVETYKLY